MFNSVNNFVILIIRYHKTVVHRNQGQLVHNLLPKMLFPEIRR